MNCRSARYFFPAPKMTECKKTVRTTHGFGWIPSMKPLMDDCLSTIRSCPLSAILTSAAEPTAFPEHGNKPQKGHGTWFENSTDD